MHAIEPIERLYTRRAATFERCAARLHRRCNWLSNARLVLFLLAALHLGAGLFGSTLPQWFLALGAIFAVGFVYLVVRHRAVLAFEEQCQALATINRHALAQVERAWAQLPAPTMALEATDPPFARDLDLFGRSSLVQLLGGGGATPLGRRALRRWLLEPAEPEAIRARQPAVAELAGQLNRRQRFLEQGRRLVDDGQPTERFIAWAEGPPWLSKATALRWIVRISPLVLVATAIIERIGLVAVSLWIWILVFQIALSLLRLRRVHELFNRVSSRAGEIERYASLFALVGARAAQSGLLAQLESEMNHTGHGATAQLGRLARLMSLADLRYSNLVHGMVQAFTLWDFHVLDAIERWQVTSGAHARAWFDALAQWDALATLAGLAHDNPQWAFAELVDRHGEAVVAAEQIGHPLLAARDRVVNDVSIGPPGTFLLVTGSNMSGKSTLLRAVGINLILAQAGGPVAARALRLPPVVLGTSMRIEDSLADGTSLFMAELKRLKQIVDISCRQQAAGHERRLFFLLDEILHGTNSVERQIAVRRVMLHLLQQGAIGAISTHDLALANVSPLDKACEAVHFQEGFGEANGARQMTFDYKLRSGLATTTNALALLELVGLVPPVEGEERGGSTTVEMAKGTSTSQLPG